MTKYTLTPKTAFGHDQALQLRIGVYDIRERIDLSLASVTARKGQGGPVRDALEQLVGGVLGVSSYHEGDVFSAFWSSRDQWFVSADHATHETLARELSEQLGKSASVTEQNDGWVAFDLSGPEAQTVLERLCNINLTQFDTGSSQRTVIEHINCFVLCREAGASYRFYCGRSFAKSFLHALETAVSSVTAISSLETM